MKSWSLDMGGWRGLEREEISQNFSIWWRDISMSCGRACDNGN